VFAEQRSPISSESHCEWFRAFARGGEAHEAAVGVDDSPAEMPFDTIVLRVLRPMWIIFVPVSACIRRLVKATE
jgi:hypothetical protein